MLFKVGTVEIHQILAATGLVITSLGFAAPAHAQNVIKCSAVAAGGEIKVDGANNRFDKACDVTLAKDLHIKPLNPGAKINLTPTSTHTHGLIINSNGHKVTIEGVDFTFDRGFAIDIIGKQGTGDVEVKNAKIVDTRSAGVGCQSSDEDRFGLILYRVGNVQMDNFQVMGAGAQPRLQAGVALIRKPGDATAPSATFNNSQSTVQCGLAVAAVNRPLGMNNSLVENKVPCELRPKGLSDVVTHGRPQL